MNIIYLIKMNKIIENLIHKCNLGEILEEPKRIEGGLLNKMYKVSTTKGKYALKLLNPEVMSRKDGKKNIIFTEKVSNIAKSNGIKCISAYEINGELIQSVDNNYFLVFDWFEGKPITEEELTLDKINKIAKELALLHKIDYSSIKNECNIYYELEEINFEFYLQKITNMKIKKLLNDVKDRFSELDKESIKNMEFIKNNLVISHRDLDLPNILWDKNDKPVIIDWETSGLVNPTLEVIDTAWNWAGGKDFFDKNKYRSFLDNYIKEGGTLKDYEKAFKADFKAKLRWFEYNLKRITIFDFLDDEEKKLGENEVIRSADEIIKFDFYSNDMKYKI